MAENQILHKNITVIGHVQGVGFRYSCMTVANSLGIKGYVKNLYDGSVYIEAEGTQKQLKLFIDWCNEGPRFASINNVVVTESQLKHFYQFDISH